MSFGNHLLPLFYKAIVCFLIGVATASGNFYRGMLSYINLLDMIQNYVSSLAFHNARCTYSVMVHLSQLSEIDWKQNTRQPTAFLYNRLS